MSCIHPGWKRSSPYLYNRWSIWGSCTTHATSGSFCQNPERPVPDSTTLQTPDTGWIPTTAPQWLISTGRAECHPLLCWGSAHLLSLKTLHVLGLENRGVDLISRGCPLPDRVGGPIPWRWSRFGPSSGKQQWICPLPDATPIAHYMVLSGTSGRSTFGSGAICTHALAGDATLCLSAALPRSTSVGDSEAGAFVRHSIGTLFTLGQSLQS